MRNAIIAIVSLSALAVPGVAAAQDAGAGAAAGAATGAVTGAIVGGPVGAAVGAGVGGVAGAAAADANRGPDTVVVDRRPSDCSTRTTRTENAYGESRTVTERSCD